MKTTIKTLTKAASLLLIAAGSFSSPIYADAATAPDLAKAFTSEQLVSNTEMEGMTVLTYVTDLEFDNLKSQLSEYLGDAWTEMPLDEATKKQGAASTGGVPIAGTTIFMNPSTPTTNITLTQLEMPMMGKAFTASITVMDMAKMHGGL